MEHMTKREEKKRLEADKRMEKIKERYLKPPTLKPPLALEIFDSHNTSSKGNPYRNTPTENVESYAKVSSFPFKCIIHDVNGAWIEYEKGKITSWSTNA